MSWQINRKECSSPELHRMYQGMLSAAKLSIMWLYLCHNRFTALFLGPPGWAGARRELLDFMVQWKINRGRHTDHPDGCHSVRTNQCPPPPSSPYFLQAGCSSCRPTNSVKALKAIIMWLYLHSICSLVTKNKAAIRRRSHTSTVPDRKFLQSKEISNLLRANMLRIRKTSFMFQYMTIKVW